MATWHHRAFLGVDGKAHWLESWFDEMFQASGRWVDAESTSDVAHD